MGSLKPNSQESDLEKDNEQFFLTRYDSVLEQLTSVRFLTHQDPVDKLH